MSADPTLPFLAPLCAICGHPVKLENAKADSFGRTVHDDCYIQVIARKPPTRD